MPHRTPILYAVMRLKAPAPGNVRAERVPKPRLLSGLVTVCGPFAGACGFGRALEGRTARVATALNVVWPMPMRRMGTALFAPIVEGKVRHGIVCTFVADVLCWPTPSYGVGQF